MSENETAESNSGSAVAVMPRTDPGASRHGNFMNYYQFHSAEERTRQLPRGAVWQRPTATQHHDRKYIGLDVGCNAGDLTKLLQRFLRDEIDNEDTMVHVLGIDIDPRLIERARESNESPEHVNFECLDFMNVVERSKLLDYLAKFSRQRFDVIFCFSVTMWIHVNHGDQGLVNYLEAIAALTDLIVIEPQSWKCYRNASRRLRRAGHDDFPLINSLKLTGDVASHIDRIILERCAFRRLTVTEPNQWDRRLLIYERNDHTTDDDS